MFSKYTQSNIEKEFVRTGLASFDYVTGGLEIGKTYEIRASEDCSDRELALSISKSLISKKWNVLYFDVEGLLNLTTLKRYGFSNSTDGQRYLFMRDQKALEIRDICLDTLSPDEKILVVIDSLLPMLSELSSSKPAFSPNNFMEQQQLRSILAEISVAVKNSGSLLLLLNNQHNTQFHYVPPNRYIDKEFHFPFPTHLLGGIVNLQNHDIEKKYEDKMSPFGQRVKISCKQYQFGKPNFSDYMYRSFDRGFSNVRTLIKIAREQGIINKIRDDKKSIFYTASKIKDFPQTRNLLGLQRLLEDNEVLRAELLKSIDWKGTIYGTQPENR